jgi:signal peptidase I
LEITEKKKVRRDAVYLAIKAALIVGIFALVFTFIFGLGRVADASMYPAVKDGDLVLFYRLDKQFVQSDVCVLRVDGKLQVRRVIAVAGDTVDITDEGLLINGSLQQESGITEETKRYDTEVSFPLTVGEGQIFVLGDSRENSEDSRMYGCIDADAALGKVITIIRRRGI